MGRRKRFPTPKAIEAQDVVQSMKKKGNQGNQGQLGARKEDRKNVKTPQTKVRISPKSSNFQQRKGLQSATRGILPTQQKIDTAITGNLHGTVRMEQIMAPI